jgi:hypothetical protein
LKKTSLNTLKRMFLQKFTPLNTPLNSMFLTLSKPVKRKCPKSINHEIGMDGEKETEKATQVRNKGFVVSRLLFEFSL